MAHISFESIEDYLRSQVDYDRYYDSDYSYQEQYKNVAAATERNARSKYCYSKPKATR